MISNSSGKSSGYEDSYKNKMIISVKDIEDYDSIIAASVLPGKKAKFYASFEVDPDFKLFEFVYDDGGILQF